ncbi:SGNH/GDSL hydrolase family protein [Halalkalibaculum sp. DA384]|uniref:SGNH/GDSL hydrolase family protein n=1 Tax=Halalkalibaculum sp. DA384 TaxID=3373606 RepID=UPI003754733E
MNSVNHLLIDKAEIIPFSTCTVILFLLMIFGCDRSNPNVLIIGDSISAGYTPFVREALEGKAVIERIEGNAEHTGTGLNKIHDWLGSDNWDIILFNWGLWDLCYRHPDAKVYGNRDKINGTITNTPDVYRKNLDSIVDILKNTGAKPIFITTTCIPENEAGRFKGDEKIYNEVALEVMARHRILVYDLYNISCKVHAKHAVADGDVHFTTEGYEQLSKGIITMLERELGYLTTR